MVVGVQTWSRWSFSWTNLAPVGLFIPNMSLFWQQHIVLYLKCGVSCESIMHRCVQFSKIMVVGFQPWTFWSFSWTDIAIVALYMIWYRPRCSLRYHFMVHIENISYFVGIGPIRDVELTYIFRPVLPLCTLYRR